jgi:putative endonuclease
MSDSWFVYMLRCADGSLYTGITKDITRRIDEHNNDGKLASAYTRSRRPVTLVYQETCKDRSVASIREAEIKSLSREEKEILIK